MLWRAAWLASLLSGGLAQKNVPCFWETSSFPQFTSEHIDVSLCSHLIYNGHLDSETWELTHRNRTLDIDLGGFRNVSNMKMKRPNLKVEISVGGWQTPNEYYVLAEDESKRASFISSSMRFLSKHGLDGLFIHWGNPTDQARTTGISTDRKHLTNLVKDMKKAFGSANLTISLGIWSPLASKIDGNFDLPEIYKHVDFVFVNAYHYHGSWEKKTGAFAPIFSSSNSRVPSYKYSTVDQSWGHMKERGAVACKTILVIRPKGSGFRLANSTNHGMGDETIGAPIIGAAPLFNQICKANKTGQWTEEWDNERKVSFMYKGDEWVSFESRRAVEEKVRYAKSEQMGGVAVSTLDMDDYLGECFGLPHPLLRTIYEGQEAGLCSGTSRQASLILTLVIINYLAL
jgi:chitinase